MITSREVKAKILKFVGSKKPVDFDIKNVKNVLFFRYDRIGDMVIATPVFRELKLAHPQVKITILASKINEEVLINNPYVDQIVTNHKNNFFSDLPLLLKLRKQKFDVCIEFDHSVVPHAIIRLKIIKPKKIISIKKDGRYGVSGNELSMYDVYTEKLKNRHFRDIWLETLSPFNIKPKSNHYDLFCSDFQKKIAQNFLSNFPKKFLIGINLEGAVKGKKIEDEDLEKICRGLNEANKNIQIIILSSPNKYQSYEEKIKNIALDYVVMSYKTDTIMDVAALITKLDLIITPDTSIAHIASTFNKPIVTIHENNKDSFRLWSPTSSLSKTIFASSSYGLENYSVEDIVDSACDILKIIEMEL